MNGLTDRGRLVLLLALGIYLVAWAFGSRSLYPVATGLALAAVGARIWVALIRQPVSLRRSLGTKEPLEGDNVTVSDSAFHVNLAAYPDLQVEGLAVTGPDAAGTYTVSWTTANRCARLESGSS